MPSFEAGQVVRVPFPYTDRPVRQHRPALVVSASPLGPQGDLLWVLMITSAENRQWPDDILIESDREAAGLPVASLIRPVKIATINAAAASPIGRVSDAVLQEVRGKLCRIVGAEQRSPR
jgi:mRNA interferase MazF